MPSINSYIEKGLPAIPDKFASKAPAIKGWTKFCDELPTKEDLNNWSTALSNKHNISICLGKASGLVALDLDTEDQEVIDKIKHLLPESPLEKKGAKGWTRFFKYSGELPQLLKYNGKVVLEILSSNKKTTIPPSIHPNGEAYTWQNDNNLLNYDLDNLPMLPPMLIPVLESKLGYANSPFLANSGNSPAANGRNASLSSRLGTLLSKPHSIDSVVKDLVEFDAKEHKVPYFTDREEYSHTHAETNALLFYTSHLNSFNSKRFRKSEEYIKPVLPEKKLTASARPEKQTKESELVRIAPEVLSLYMRERA